MASERSLGTLYSHSLASFQKFLVRCSRYGELESSRGLERCYEEYSRLKIWGHQKRATLGPSVPGSLEAALQDRPELQNILLEIYEQIIDCFQQLDLLPSGSLIGSLVLLTDDHNSDDESEPTDSGLEPASGALDPVFEGIEEIYRLSSLISRPRLTGRYLRSTRPILDPACQQEHQHIRQKFLTWRTHQEDDIVQDYEQKQEIGMASQTVLPKEETATPDLIANRQSAEEMHNPLDYILSQRLAIANMKRREQLRYWDAHPYQIKSEKLEPIGSGLPPPPSSVFTTTSVPRSTIILDQSNLNINAISRTNYAPTEVGKYTAMRVPDMPQSAGLEFSCPFCHMALNTEEMKVRANWKRHVFRDLRPYTCTFSDCQDPERLFTTRYDWRYHEAQLHRRQWACQSCSCEYASKLEMTEHLRYHNSSIKDRELIALLDMSERPIDEGHIDRCPFCHDTMSTKELFDHMAGHMEELALLALPRDAGEDTEEKKTVEEDTQEIKDMGEGMEQTRDAQFQAADAPLSLLDALYTPTTTISEANSQTESLREEAEEPSHAALGQSKGARSGLLFYCCNCNYGPWNTQIDPRCQSCTHQRCSGCVVSSFG